MRTPNQQTSNKKTTSLFSCAFFRQCTESPLSPTPPHTSPPSVPVPPPLPNLISPPPLSAFHHPTTTTNNNKPSSSSSSSSSSASQSFTQWRFPPTYHNPIPPHSDLFQMAELHFQSGTISDHQTALSALEQTLVPNPGQSTLLVPPSVMNGILLNLALKSATKVLLALCLSETNRHVAISCGAPSRVLDLLADLDGPVAERALAALDLMCTVSEGSGQVRAHALAVPMLVSVMGKMEGRGREYAISVLSAVYSEWDDRLLAVAPPEELARAVVLAMQQGDCSPRGKRKGGLLLKVLQLHSTLDFSQ